MTVDLGRSRELLYQLTLRDIRIRYKQAALGFAWAAFITDPGKNALGILQIKQ